MIYIGLMSGTSMDGIDAVLVDFKSDKPELIASLHTSYENSLKKELSQLITTDAPISLVARADHRVGLAFAESVNNLLKKCSVNKEDCAAIGSHGQNIFHQPDTEFPVSIQIGDPNIITEQTGITTVADFRRRDMAAGGQGAPLAPAFHEMMFRKKNHDTVVLNLGGISNITILSGNPDQATTGFDCGPGNTLMDSWSLKNQHKAFDENGDWAARGVINQALLTDLLNDPYFQKQPPKSTGREYFNLPWLEARLSKYSSLKAIDIQATLCELTALCCGQAIKTFAPDVEEVLVCGGGVHNAALMARLAAALPDCHVKLTSTYGVDPDWVEAIAFAWMAKQTLENKPSGLPGVTGASHPVILGGVYKA
ncbi:MAG: anhydro-N-acetylmuramic acid kinase [Acidiferrobacterales bacterium]